MDRRRFAPTTEGLEQRALLATTPNFTNLFGFQVNSNLNIPITYQQKVLRVEHLPYYIGKIRPGRYVPAAEMQQIQGALFQVISRIRKPNPAVLDNYNRGLRPIVNKQSITAADAKTLNQNFGSVLMAASVSPSVVDSLKSAVFKMVTQVDTASPQPAYLATNDYSLILQTALSIGRPMPAPILPKVARNTGIQAGPSHIKTPLRHPILVDTYHFHTHIQIITPGGIVVGEAKVHENNNYRVQIYPPLTPGVYKFQVRAVDDGGNLSRLSRVFEIKVVPMRHHPPKK